MRAARPLAAAICVATINGFFLQARAEVESNDFLGELSLEELLEVEVETVYSASKFEQKVTEAPASVTIITAKDIKKFGYRNLADILGSARGFYTTYDRNYWYAGVRGFGRPGDYNTRFLLLINGHRANDNIYDTTWVDNTFPLDADLIDRVEIIRGSSASLYGANAFFGVVNVIVKEAADLSELELSAEAHSFGGRSVRISSGLELPHGAALSLSGTLYDSDGESALYYPEFDDPSTNNGFAEHGDYEKFGNFFGSLAIGEFSLEGGYNDRKKGIPTGAWGVVYNDPRSRTIDQVRYLDLQFRHKTPSDSEILGRLFMDSYYYTGNYVYDWADPGDPPDIVIFRDESWGKFWGSEFQFVRPVGQRDKLTVGLGYRNNYRQDQRSYDVDPYFSYLDDQRSSTNWGIYLQGEHRVNDKFLLNAGVRHDDYSTFGGATKPRLAAIYSPKKDQTYKLMYGGAFRPPNAYEQYYHDGGITAKPNPNLDPETIGSVELVHERYFSNGFSAAVSAFYNKIGNLINQNTDPADGLIQFVNAGRIDVRGFELELERKSDKKFSGRISYAFQNSKDKESGQALSNSPRRMAKLALSHPLDRGRNFQAGFEARYTGSRKTLSGSAAKAYALANLTISGRDSRDRWEAAASVYNLFNRKYGNPGFEEHKQDIIEQDGRAFRLELTRKF